MKEIMFKINAFACNVLRAGYSSEALLQLSGGSVQLFAMYENGAKGELRHDLKMLVDQVQAVVDEIDDEEMVSKGEKIIEAIMSLRAEIKHVDYKLAFHRLSCLVDVAMSEQRQGKTDAFNCAYLFKQIIELSKKDCDLAKTMVEDYYHKIRSYKSYYNYRIDRIVEPMIELYLDVPMLVKGH